MVARSNNSKDAVQREYYCSDVNNNETMNFVNFNLEDDDFIKKYIACIV